MLLKLTHLIYTNKYCLLFNWDKDNQIYSLDKNK